MTSQDLVDSKNRELQVGVQAAEVVAGGDLVLPPDDYTTEGQVLVAAQAALRRAGDFRRLETLCQGRLDDDPEAMESSEDIWQCIADAQVLQGRPEDAVDTLADAAEALYPQVFIGPDMLLRWGAARLAVQPGDEEGRRLLQQAAVQGPSYPAAAAALMRLGTDGLDRGSPAVAVAHYDLALALLDPHDAPGEDGSSRVRQGRVVALTNRGVGLLRLAQDDPTHPPVCLPDVKDDPCTAAAADFTAALSIDPLNAVTLMNQAWAYRAMGRLQAAREALVAATTADPSLYPAANDLGVLAARAGDDTAALSVFHRPYR